MEEAYNLEDPEADKHLNSGTSAPNCQPKHTQENGDGEIPIPSQHKNQRTSSTASVRDAQEERRKRQHTSHSSSSSLDSQQEQEMSQQKKLSYFQMAKLGYQELVNAIIRPTRADYKVRNTIVKCWSLRRGCK